MSPPPLSGLHLRSRRKAQISIFMVLGVIVLLSLGLFFVLRGSNEQADVEDDAGRIVQELPSELLPIRPFVEQCLEKTAINGLVTLGQRGGYAYSDTLTPRNPPTTGDSVQFSSGSDLIIPYWFYLESQNNCEGRCDFSTKQIPLRTTSGVHSIEKQLSRYIEENIEFCFSDFNSLKELGFSVEELDSLQAGAVVAQRDVSVNLNYPLKISKDGSTIEVDRFTSRIDLDLQSIYDMAHRLTELQKEYRFLEKFTANLIVGFSGKDTAKLPPMSDSSFETSSNLRWQKSEVKNSLKSILSSYTPLLRVVGSSNYREVNTGNRFIDNTYNADMIIPGNETHLAVNFNYLDLWEPYFDLNCDGENCQAESGFFDFLPVGIQRYQFAYDMSYPVLVEIEDPTAFNDQGYTFQFMLESNMRNNRPLPAVFTSLPAVESGDTQFCDLNKRTSGAITLSVDDSLSGSAVDGVDVFYSCIDSCYIGKIERGRLQTALPVCLGGTLSFMKEGYETSAIPYDASLNRADSLSVSMVPQKEFTLEVRKLQLSKLGDDWLYSGQESLLLEDESATVTIIRGNDIQFAEYSALHQDNITLSPGSYEIEIQLIAERRLDVPERTIKVEDETLNIDGYNSSSFLLGSSSYNHTFTASEMESNKIILYALSADLTAINLLDRRIQDLQVQGNFDELTGKYLFDLRPRLE